jgi:hypothetical protein
MSIFAVRIVAVCSALLLASCASQSVYVQQLRTDGTQVKPPLFMTDNPKEGDVRLVPKVAVGIPQKLVGRTPGHSNVNDNGVYQVDTVGSNEFIERAGVNKHTFQGRNFHWEPPRVTASLDFEYFVTKTFSIVAGANYASSSSRSFLGAAAGVGFSFESKNLGIRVDLGAHWSSVAYDVDYGVATKQFGQTDSRVEFFHETGKSSYLNSYGAFTINTKINTWALQGFLQLGINRLTLVDMTRRTSITDNAVVLQSASFFIVTPGFFVEVASGTRIVAGVHLSDETELLEADPGVLVVPFLQFEFGL